MSVKRKVLFVAITLLFICAASRVMAEDLCIDKADSALGKLKTWSDLRLWYENYPGWDDGYLAEGLSDFVVVTLAKRWNTLPSLQTEIRKNSGFRHFVLKHIDATTDESDVRTTLNNARRKCPGSSVPLCRGIEMKAGAALKEIEKE